MVQPNPTGNSVEQRAFSYYVERTAPRLEGFMFEARGFFSTVVPQVGQSEMAVTHMVIALATIHEALSVQFQVSNTQRRLFYFHQNQAAKLLINNNTLPSIEIVLIVCLLFLACENFQGSVINGSKHVRSGLRMLDDWDHRLSHPSSLMADIVRRAIKPIFGRLSEQTPVLGTSSLMSPATTVSRTTCNLAGALTASHLENAQDELLQIMQEITQSLPTLPPTPRKKSRIIELAGELSRWSQALQRTTVDLATENAVVINKIEELLIHVRVLLIILHTGDSPIEAVYDAFLVDFRLICADFERLINSRPTADDESRHETDRSLPKSLGMIPPLFTVAYRCRHPAVRRRAVRLLHALNQREGSWDSCTAAISAQAVISIEERGLTLVETEADVREHRRIRVTAGSLVQEDMWCLVLKFSRYPYCDDQEETIRVRLASTGGCKLVEASHEVRPSALSKLSRADHIPDS